MAAALNGMAELTTPRPICFWCRAPKSVGFQDCQRRTSQYIPGQPYEGGALPRRQNATGVLSAVDVDTGKLRWRNALPYPAEGGVLVTSTGLAFSSDVGGKSLRLRCSYWAPVLEGRDRLFDRRTNLCIQRERHRVSRRSRWRGR